MVHLMVHLISHLRAHIMDHLSIICRLFLSRQVCWMAPPDGSAVQALCLATFQHGSLHQSQFTFAFASRCAAVLLGHCTVVKKPWLQFVLLAFDLIRLILAAAGPQ
jgi:hypothetical protein